jgi:hypothetical protein
MILQGTPGRTKIVQIDPNNQRVDLDTATNFSGGTFNQVTVNSAGFVTAGKFIKPSTPSSGSGGTTASNLYDHYGGSSPLIAGAVRGQLAIDADAGKLWVWDGGQWVNLL